MVRVSDFSMMILMVCAVAICGSYFMADFASSYGMTGPDTQMINSTAYSSINNIVSNYTSFQATMTSTNRTTVNSILDNAWNFIGFMSGAFINAGLLFLNIPGIFSNLFTGIASYLPIPGVIITIMGVAVIVAISLAIYRTVSKSDI